MNDAVLGKTLPPSQKLRRTSLAEALLGWLFVARRLQIAADMRAPRSATQPKISLSGIVHNISTGCWEIAGKTPKRKPGLGAEIALRKTVEWCCSAVDSAGLRLKMNLDVNVGSQSAVMKDIFVERITSESKAPSGRHRMAMPLLNWPPVRRTVRPAVRVQNVLK